MNWGGGVVWICGYTGRCVDCRGGIRRERKLGKSLKEKEKERTERGRVQVGKKNGKKVSPL